MRELKFLECCKNAVIDSIIQMKNFICKSDILDMCLIILYEKRVKKFYIELGVIFENTHAFTNRTDASKIWRILSTQSVNPRPLYSISW